jgi:hypothetical protein
MVADMDLSIVGLPEGAGAFPGGDEKTLELLLA